MKENEIIDFIYENFSKGRKKLIPKINEFLLNNECTQNFKEKFTELENIPYVLSSYSSDKLRNSKTKSSEVGDISDIWTFCLNSKFLEGCKEGNLYCKIDESINKGNEIHTCKVWINWFLPIYYIETTYELRDKKKGIEQFGNLKLEDKIEIDNYKKILKALESLNYKKLELSFLNTKLKNISTDCSERKNATIFECLFSDLVYPTRHIRKKINKKTKSTLPSIAFTEYLDINRDLEYIEADIYHHGLSSINLTFDRENKLIQILSRKGKIEKKKNEIRIQFKNE